MKVHGSRSPDGDGPAQSTERSRIGLQPECDSRGGEAGNTAAQPVPAYNQAWSEQADSLSPSLSGHEDKEQE